MSYEVIVTKNSRKFEMVVLSDGNTLEFLNEEDACVIPDRIAKQLTSVAVCLDHEWVVIER
jgi:hypothetical protein